MTTTQYATRLLRKCGQWAVRRRVVVGAVSHTPSWAWPAVELAALTTAVAGTGWVLVTAWATTAALAAPWWSGIVALAFPAGAFARFLMDAPAAVTRYRNWRAHAVDLAVERTAQQAQHRSQKGGDQP